MPSSYFKTVLIVLAALIAFLGAAGLVTARKPDQPLAQQMGMGKGSQEPIVQQAEERTDIDEPVAVERAAPRKFAVIIGIVYDNSDLGTVNYADRDAQSMYDLLVGRLGYPPENVILLKNFEATRGNIFTALQWLATNPQIDSSSDVVFFYSGHGLRSLPNVGLNIPNVPSAYALVPVDFRNFDYKMGQGLLWDADLKNFLGGIKAGRMWINIDSCSSGGFNQPGITGPNRIVTMSSAADQLSGEIPETQRGVMMQFLVEEGISQGLSVEDAFAFAAIRAFQHAGQNPQIADEYAGNMDLGKSPWSPIN